MSVEEEKEDLSSHRAEVESHDDSAKKFEKSKFEPQSRKKSMETNFEMTQKILPNKGNVKKSNHEHYGTKPD